MENRLVRTKPYKAVAPEATVRRIQGILQRLGLHYAEQRVDGNEPYFAYCLRLLNRATGQPIFQTMGKGGSDAYARASAYGEMIERLQNFAFYTMLKYPSEPETAHAVEASFKYVPDERRVAGGDLTANAAGLFRNPSDAARLLDDPPRLAIPYWNVFEARPEYMPFRAMQLIVGSNGMCSGNTPAEALIHGICEVFERHVLKRMFTHPFCPPDVPLAVFEGHEVQARIRDLAQKHGYEVRVKDCSLGNRLPVLGVLVTTPDGRYAFHLGSDPSPVTAAERCLTEMFQGGQLILKDRNEWPGHPCTPSTSPFWRRQLHLNIRSYEGHWPDTLLSGQPDPAFEGFAHPASISDADDLEYLLQTLRKENQSLLIRDNSFLGHPSYHVYIPGMSPMTNAVDDAFVRECLAFDRHLPVLSNLRAAGADEKRELAHALAGYARVAPTGQFRAGDYMLYYRQHPVAAMTPEELLARLEQDAPTENLPPCFECGPCAHNTRCGYGHVSEVWQRMKQCMTESGLVQNRIV